MIDRFVYPPEYHLTQEPANLEDIRARLGRRRPSLDQSRFSNDDYSEFLKNRRKAVSKSSALTLVFSTFVGNLDILYGQDISFRRLERLTDGTISKPRPEFYDGVHPSKIGRWLREDLASLITPSNNPSAPILPTFLMTAAAPTSTMTCLERAV